ncbi:MAG: hypothetical protein HYY67_02550 [Thaumarchaeota archaeon]|nr:hypothetical protein [Nitrososphaerota archaeon]
MSRKLLTHRSPSFLSRIPNSNITTLEPIDEQQVKDLIDHIPEKERQIYSLSKEVLAGIVRKSNANARGAVQLLNNVYYAAWKEKKPITVNMVERIAG